MTDKATQFDKSIACLILGAYGDALGAPVEFMSREEIIKKYGNSGKVKGIQYLDHAYGKRGAITDDTQMTLFAAEGLIHAFRRGQSRGILGDYSVYVATSYLRWLETQGRTNFAHDNIGSWGSEELYNLIRAQGQRAPGNTCISALSAYENNNSARNDSKGCGTVMRVAPYGLFFGARLKEMSRESLLHVYTQAKKDAAITHGHETAMNSSGFLAVIIARSLQGEELSSAVDKTLQEFGTPDIEEIVKKAVDLASAGASHESVHSLGAGWVAEEAIAIGIYSSLLCEKGSLSVQDALRLAVNHDGDSDSTGAITGNLIGVAMGREALQDVRIPEDSEIAEIQKTIREYGLSLIDPNL